MGTWGSSRRWWAVFVVLAALLGAGTGAEARPPRATIDFPDTDALLGSCVQLVPHTIALTDATVQLDLRVVLDGVTRAQGAAAVVGMRRAYARLGIAVAATYDPVRFTGRDANGLLAQAKQEYGGRRPAGVDVVYVLTDKDVVTSSVTGGQLAGLADCIGGIRYPTRAFAVGELGAVSAAGVADGTAKTMAHEVGHLLGAHHHHTSPEGVLDGDLAAPLSLMGPAIDLIALRFSTVEALMVRGHAQRYAR
ncbi:zinc-dependent metalloprotease family protein [Nocardioides sp.]|uniref:zinc-dependent metalloprotease family protein n=1 Tax=Nocardioides sp. TaxID=35761 RepID=UPI00271C28A8|nr:zinc-dependent metalloprotease family protein [Nocardioides sp.]MDO9456044.1 zinc-dependent metalloprotease family protein [Nocardioides sp.]